MKQHDDNFLKLVESIRGRIEETDVISVKKRQDNEEALFLIDVREESEWKRGHVPGAIHLSKGILERDIAKHARHLDHEIVLYCGGGFRSILAADNLLRMGYTNVVSVDGGFSQWVEFGYPIAHLE